jgi:hypothetical protein
MAKQTLSEQGFELDAVREYDTVSLKLPPLPVRGVPRLPLIMVFILDTVVQDADGRVKSAAGAGSAGGAAAAGATATVGPPRAVMRRFAAGGVRPMGHSHTLSTGAALSLGGDRTVPPSWVHVEVVAR